jgi:hypothetical protein
MNLRHFLAFGISLPTLASCSGEDTTMASEERSRSGAHTPQVVVEPTPSNHVVGSRRVEEAAALNQLFSRTPERYLTRLEAVLTHPNVDFVGSPDTEEAALLSTILSIRQADRAAAGSQSRSSSHPTPPAGRPVTVTPAIVATLEPEDAVATIRWELSEPGHPILLIREDEVRDEIVAAGMSAVRAALSGDRDTAPPEASLSIRRMVPTAARSPSAPAGQRFIQALRRAPVKHISGVGLVRSLDMVVFVP